MARAFWKGSLSFGLVEIPVGLSRAVAEDELHFTLLDRRDFSPVGNRHYNKSTGREVAWEDIVRGYEYEPDEFVVLTEDELEAANVEAAHTIAIEQFVEAGAIPPVFFETPYFVEPQVKGSRSYALLRAALERTGRVGVARVVLRSRQRLAALIVRDGVLMLDLLRYPHELRAARDVAGASGAGAAKVADRELKMAERLIGEMVAPWRPGDYRDAYRDDVLELVKRKVKSGQTHEVVETTAPRPRRAREVVDLMDALKQSLERRGAAGRKASSSESRGATREDAAVTPGRPRRAPPHRARKTTGTRHGRRSA